MSDELEPIPMLLFCPKCNTQHIDAPEILDCRWPDCGGGCGADEDGPMCMAEAHSWENPPHRSHLCHECGTIWRPADVATVGVAEIATQGKADNWQAPAALMRAATGGQR